MEPAVTSNPSSSTSVSLLLPRAQQQVLDVSPNADAIIDLLLTIGTLTSDEIAMLCAGHEYQDMDNDRYAALVRLELQLQRAGRADAATVIRQAARRIIAALPTNRFSPTPEIAKAQTEQVTAIAVHMGWLLLGADLVDSDDTARLATPWVRVIEGQTPLLAAAA